MLAFVFPTVVPYGGLTPVLVFAVAAVTDYVDGPIARRAGTASSWGGVLDNVADIAFVLGGATAGVMLGRVPWVAPAAIMASVTGYVLASRRMAAEGGAVQLARSRVGHLAGVANYVLVGTLVLQQALAGLVPERVVWIAGWGTAAINAAAVLGRLGGR